MYLRESRARTPAYRVRLTLVQKILLPAVAAILITTGLFLFITYNQTVGSIISAEDQKLNSITNGFEFYINQRIEQALSLADSIAKQQVIQAAVAQRDRATLIREIVPIYESLRDTYGVSQAHFHIPPATSLLRLHSLEEWNDDLSATRPIVAQVNANQTPVGGIEIGKGGPGIRGVVPISYQGQHVGSFEIGLNLDEPSLKTLQNTYGGEWHLMLNNRVATRVTVVEINEPGPAAGTLSFANTTPDFVPIQSTAYDAVLDNGDRVIERVSVGNNHYAVLLAPVYDSQGEIVGAVQVDFPRNEVVAQINQGQINLLVTGLSVIVPVTLALGLIIWGATRSIKTLTRAAESFSQGHLDVQINVTSQDEIGTLAGVFKQMAAQLRDLIGTLETRIAERTRDLQTVADVNAQIATILDVDRLLQDVVDLTKERFRLYHAHIYLLDETGNTLVLRSGAGHVGRQMVSQRRTISIHNEQSIVANAARTQQGVIINDVTQSPTFLPHPLLPDTQAELAVPLVARGRLLGVLDIQSEKVNYFSAEVLSTMELMAGQIATALSNAQLYEVAARTSRHERALGQIDRKIQDAVNMDEILQTTVRELGKALRVPYTAVELRLDTDSDQRDPMAESE